MRQESAARNVLIFSSLGMLSLGIVTASIGPLLPELATRTGSSLAALGSIFTVLFFGGLFAQVITGPASDRLGQRPILLAGLALFALGAAGMAAGRSLPALLAWGLVAGMGQGALDVGANVLVAVMFARRSVAALNFLHLFFGLGSVLGPAAVSLSLGLWKSGLPALWFGSLLLTASVPLAYALVPRVSVRRGRRPQASPAAVYLSPLLWALAAFLGIYVGVEIGTGGWTTAYLGEVAGLPVATAALVTSGYWLGLTTGRLVAALIGSRVAAPAVLAVDMAGALLAAAGLAFASATWAIVAATLLMGLSFGSIYPTVMALATTEFKAGPGKAAGAVAAAGSLGGMTFPLIQGLLLTGQGPAASARFVAAGVVAMAALFLVAMLLRGRRMPDRSPVLVPGDVDEADR